MALIVMPIPPWNDHGVIPPFLGAPTNLTTTSPYPATIKEVVQAFAGSTARRDILVGLIAYRIALIQAGGCGFQWIAGSFVESIEQLEGRDPRDVDVVNFLRIPPSGMSPALRALFERSNVKSTYHCDSFLVRLTASVPQTEAAVCQASFWNGLFGHRRTGLWKGVVKIPLDELDNEIEARKILDRGGSDGDARN